MPGHQTASPETPNGEAVCLISSLRNVSKPCRMCQRPLWYNPVMKKDLMDILVCPVCKGELDLEVVEENGQEIVTGSLYCRKCEALYPIRETIPGLLPPDKQP